MSNNDVFTPTTDVDDLYGDGDWRSLLGPAPSKLGYKTYMIGKQSIEHKLKGVLLPSFDWTMSPNDQAFFEKVGSCWTATPDKRLQRHFTPNAFALPLLMYPYMGENMEHWLSPYNKAKMLGGASTDPDEFADAFDDLNKWIRKQFRNDEKMKDRFLKVKSLKENPKVPGRTARYFSLAWCKDKENDWHRGLIAYTTSAYSYIIEQMRWPQPHGEEARDPEWPQYLLGDPTRPENAMVWHVDKVLLDPKDSQDTNVLCFTERREFLDPDQEFKKIPQEILDGRFRLPDPANWNFPTYEEQVRYMMQNYDPDVTAEMIRAACGNRCREEIPTERPERIVLKGSSDGSPDEEEDTSSRSRSRTSRDDDDADPMAAVTGKSKFAPSGSAPPQPAEEAPAPKQETKPAAASSETYWAGLPKQKPAKMSVSDLQAIADKGEHEGVKVMVSKDNWKSLADSGLVTIPEPEPIVPDDEPTSVPDDEMPEVPDDAPTSVPDEAPTSVPSGEATEGGLSKAEFRDKLFPTWDDLGSDQQGKAAALVDRAYAATNNGTDPSLPDDIVKEMMEVMS